MDSPARSQHLLRMMHLQHAENRRISTENKSNNCFPDLKIIQNIKLNFVE